MNARNSILLLALLTSSAVAGFMVYESKNNPATGHSVIDKNLSTAKSMRPEFSLPDVQGVTRSVTEWDGKALIVNFWATWCTPCLREIPVLNEMSDELSAEGIQIIGIAVDDPEAVKQFVKKTPIQYPLLVGEQESLDVATAFGAEVIALPLTVFSNHAGEIIDLHAGEIKREDLIEAAARLRQ